MTPWLTILEFAVFAAGIAVLCVVYSLHLLFRKLEAREKAEWRTNMRRTADRQASQLQLRGRKEESLMTERIWLYIAARHLLTIWPDFALERAVHELRDYLPACFGDPDYDWTEEAARWLAEEYVREFGEQHGSNH